MVVSGNSSLCTVTYGAGTPNGNCNENQFSDPFVGPDGALYVAYNNYNNAVSGNDNRNQILLSKGDAWRKLRGAAADMPDLMEKFATFRKEEREREDSGV